MSAAVDGARREWEEGYRRYLAVPPGTAEGAALERQVAAVGAELRRRLGGTFSVADLAALYAGAESWTYDVIEEQAPSRGWVRSATTASAAAFHLYERAAVDYAP